MTNSKRLSRLRDYNFRAVPKARFVGYSPPKLRSVRKLGTREGSRETCDITLPATKRHRSISAHYAIWVKNGELLFGNDQTESVHGVGFRA